MNDISTDNEREATPQRDFSARDPGSALSRHPPGSEFRYQAPARDQLSSLATGAGMVILGLGIAQLLAPRQVARSTGIYAHPSLVRASGARAD